jgi:Tat protein secretion system quality control protein TatD with DNase activity
MKLIDAHGHITKLVPLDMVAARMDDAGVAASVIMARETREDRILEFARRYPRKVWAMTGGRLFQRALQAGSFRSRPRGVRHYRGFDPRWWGAKGDGVFRELENALDSGLYRGVGEIRLKHRGYGPDVPEMKCDYDFEADHPVILRLLETCARRKAPVVVHLEVDEDRAGRLAAFSRALDAVPRARVVWAHAGPCEARVLERMFAKHAGLFAEIQPLLRNTYAANVPYLKTFPPLVDGKGALRPDWRRLFVRRADRLMFGSDCRTAPEYEHLTVRAGDMRSLLAQIPAAPAARIARRNAEGLFTKMRRTSGSASSR